MGNRNNKYLKQIKKIRRYALMNYYNAQGWSTDKKYIVFESDDWGSIRTSSREAYRSLLEAGDNINEDPFTRYDALASEDDLSLLFGLLTKFKDKNENHPVISANCAVANPDFEKIKESEFKNYYFEPFTETMKRYKGHEKSLRLWKDGMANGVFYPQLHCREHVNITKWMHDLNNNNKDLLLAFKHGMISGGNSFSNNNLFGYMDSFNYTGTDNNVLLEGIISDAVNLFQDIFGYKAKSFTPPCYVWQNSLEEILEKNDIKYIQGSQYQLIPTTRGYGNFKKERHITGEMSQYNQMYVVRNCNFEPSLGNAKDAVDSCLAQIKNSFIWRKPAIINTHRLNYIGYIDESNRDPNLHLLEKLIREILKQWPNVEFITSVELGNRMQE